MNEKTISVLLRVVSILMLMAATFGAVMGFEDPDTIRRVAWATGTFIFLVGGIFAWPNTRTNQL